MSAWLINDQLSAMGERTFWHYLLEWFSELEFIAGKYTPFNEIVSLVNNSIDKPRYVIRNATYFPWIDFKCPVISFVQDIVRGALKLQQEEVISKSDIVVYNSLYTKLMCGGFAGEVIPIGVDFDLFIPHKQLGSDVLFVGSSNSVKGPERLWHLIENTDYNFHVVMKDNKQFSYGRIEGYHKIDHVQLHKVMEKCFALVCTSEQETQHLAGIEAGAVNLSIVAPDVGIYHQLDESKFGVCVKDNDFVSALNYVKQNPVRPREYLLSQGLDLESCKKRWKELINEL